MFAHDLGPVAAGGCVSSSILACGGMDRIRPSILEPVSTLLRAESSVFMQFSKFPTADSRVVRAAYVGPTPRSASTYADRAFFRHDPVIRTGIGWLDRPVGEDGPRVAHLGSTVDIGEFSRTLYYNEFLKPAGIADVLALCVPVQAAGRHVMCVGFHRTDGQDMFTEGDISAFWSLVPAMNAALQNLGLRAALADTDGLVQGLVQQEGDVDVAVFDENFILRQATPRVIGDSSMGGTLNSLLEEVRSRMDFAWRRTGVLPEEVCFTAPLSGGDGLTRRQLDVTARRLRSSRDGDRIVIAMRHQAAGLSLAEACVAAGLTERETQVVEMLGAGLCNASIAGRLSISPRTVENHLRSIYGKLGVNSRTQLLSVLMAGRGGPRGMA